MYFNGSALGGGNTNGVIKAMESHYKQKVHFFLIRTHVFPNTNIYAHNGRVPVNNVLCHANLIFFHQKNILNFLFILNNGISGSQK